MPVDRDKTPGNSVTAESEYEIEDRAIEVRFPAEAKGVFL
jgi:hypothetical protein